MTTCMIFTGYVQGLIWWYHRHSEHGDVVAEPAIIQLTKQS